MSARSSRMLGLLVLGVGALAGMGSIGLEFVAGRVVRPASYVHDAGAAELPAIEMGSELATLYQGHVQDPLSDFGIAYDDVAFPGPDGGVLRGWWVPAETHSDVAIVTVHGAWVDRRDFLRRLPMLHRAGYPVLLFDCREHGASDGDRLGASFGQRERSDVTAAVHYLREELGYRRVVAFGESQGAVAAVLAAADDARIDALILENPFATLRSGDVRLPGMQGAPAWLEKLLYRAIERRIAGRAAVYPVDVIERVAGPILVMHGAADRLIPFEHSRRLYARAGEPKSIWIAPYATHNALINFFPDRYERRVLEFLQQHAPVEPVSPS